MNTFHLPPLSRYLPFVLLALFAVALAASAPAALASPTASPGAVTLAGNFEHLIAGCGDWDPGCADAHLVDQGNGVWRGEFNLGEALPDGQYKIALNNSWNESYAGNHTKDGNTTLVTGGPATVRFYYDDKTHAVLDGVMDKIGTVAGDFQSEIGCPGDWQPQCVQSLMTDVDGDGLYSFETTSIPVGPYQFKVARDEKWDVSYPKDNVTFSVTKTGQDVRFFWDSTNNNVWVVAGHAHDNNVEWNGLGHDSRDPLYRTPGGAVAVGTPVTLRFRTFHDDVTSVQVRLWDVNANAQQMINLSLAANDVSCYSAPLSNDSCDFWATTLNPSQPNNYWYRLIIQDGTSTAYYADDTPALDGGLGAPSSNIVDNSYALMFYDPKFKVPAWVHDSVIYQIFPDRFRNADPANDPKTGHPRYVHPALPMTWSDLPEGYCRDYYGATPENCPWRFDGGKQGTEQPRGRDYYGGDIQGVIQNLDYLKSIGVTAIYFNPIFYAKSNHRYDTADYKQMDPYLGTLNDFKQLVNEAKRRNMKVILDGVFNHMSSDSPNFDRYNHYPGSDVACENAASSFRSWFHFRPPSGGEPSPCVPTVPGGTDTYYDGWFNFDSIPVLTKSLPAVQDYFINAKDSVTRYWSQNGALGWRMDVMGDSSFPNGYWEAFRQVVKGAQDDSVIIGELWQKDITLLRFLRGDRADSTMDYRFRDAMMVWLAPNASFDSKGFPDSGHSVAMSGVAARLQAILEDYPPQVSYSLMNLVDSHDTERALWTLTPGQANRDDREFNAANLAQGKLNLGMVSLLQFTMPGAPTIYYGDEVGITGSTDPDDRRTYPWTDLGGKPDQQLLAQYQSLGKLRGAVPALTSGDLKVLLTDENSRTLAFGRKTQKQAAIVVAGNGGGFDLPVSGYLPDGVVLHGVLGVNNDAKGVNVTVSSGILHVDLANKGGLVLVTDPSADLTPPQPPSGLKVSSEGNGTVSLTWKAVGDAAGYNVYESPVSGGGYVKVNDKPVKETTIKFRLVGNSNFTTSGLNNAQWYYFVVRAVDAAGNESANSNEVRAMPHYSISKANLQWPPTLQQTISAIHLTDEVYGRAWIDGVTSEPGATSTLRAQVGYGPRGSNPSQSNKWKWVEAVFNADVDGADEFKAQMLPDAVGDYDYAYRYTTTNGRDWLYADLDGTQNGYSPAQAGKMTVVPSSDTEAPSVPQGLEVTSASPSAITLGWQPSTDNVEVYNYQVSRSTTTGGPYSLIGTSASTSYVDGSVTQNGTYYYVVRAVDTSFNRSANSSEVVGTAAVRKVTVTFSVAVPDSTDGTGKSVFIAGTLDLLDGGLPSWDPGGVQLTRVDSTHWTIKLTGNEGVQIQYKYALGSWDYVEKGASCEEINNRQLTLTYGANGQQGQDDTVLNWRNVSPCGN